MPQVASKTFHTVVSTGVVTEVSSDSIKVLGVVCANGSGSVCSFIFQDNNGNHLLYFRVPSYETITFKGVWLADNGLHVTTTAGSLDTMTATVIYSGEG